MAGEGVGARVLGPRKGNSCCYYCLWSRIDEGILRDVVLQGCEMEVVARIGVMVEKAGDL